MSKRIAIPLLIAAAVGLYYAIPGLLKPTPLHPTFFYWLAAPAVACAITGLCILLGPITLPRTTMRTVPINDTSDFLLLPRQQRHDRLRNARVLCLTTAVPALLLALHLEITHRPAPPDAHLFAAAALLLFVLLSLDIIRRMRSMRLHGDPRVVLSTDHIALDKPFHIRAEVAASQPLHITELRAKILCFEHALIHVGRYVHHVIRTRNQILLPLSGPTVIPAGQTLSGSAQPILESIQYPPSGQWTNSMYPFYRWEIHIELTGDSSFLAIYPITVERPPNSPPVQT